MTKATYAVIPDPGWNDLGISFYTKDGKPLTQSWVRMNGEISVGIFDQSYFVVLIGGNGSSDILDTLRYLINPDGVVVQQK